MTNFTLRGVLNQKSILLLKFKTGMYIICIQAINDLGNHGIILSCVVIIIAWGNIRHLSHSLLLWTSYQEGHLHLSDRNSRNEVFMAKIIFFLDFKDKSKKRKETSVDGK